MVITGWAYASINGNAIDGGVNATQDTNGAKPLVSNTQQTPDLKFKDENDNTI